MPVVISYTIPGGVPPSLAGQPGGTDGEIELITSHCDDGLTRLIQQYACSPRVKALICSVLDTLQDSEQDVVDLLTKVYDLDLAEGAQLDLVGVIVGEARDGRTDVDYARALKVRVLVNRSNGKAEELLKIAVLYTGLTTAGIFEIVDKPPASFHMTIEAVFADVVGLFARLKDAKGAGIGFQLVYETSATPFTMSSLSGATELDAVLGMGSTTSPTTGGDLSHVLS